MDDYGEAAMTRAPRPDLRRAFTAYEESLMRCQADGQFSLHKLELLIQANRETILRRMREMGLVPTVQKQMRRRHVSEPRPERWKKHEGLNSAPSVGQDPLLQLLREHHSERLTAAK